MDGDDMNKFDTVPNNIISNKDLDYLKDSFGWNYVLFKNILDNSKNVKDKKIQDFLKSCSNFFYENMTIILNVLGGNINE